MKQKKKTTFALIFLKKKSEKKVVNWPESIYKDEVQQFLNRISSIVDEKGNRLVVKNGYHKDRVVQTSCGNIEVKLPRVDDRKATEKFVGRISSLNKIYKKGEKS